MKSEGKRSFCAGNGEVFTMKVTFIGATHEVTGSCTLLEVGGR